MYSNATHKKCIALIHTHTHINLCLHLLFITHFKVPMMLRRRRVAQRTEIFLDIEKEDVCHTHSFWWYWLIYIERIHWSVYKYKRYAFLIFSRVFFFVSFFRRPHTHTHTYASRTTDSFFMNIRSVRAYKRCAFVIEQKNHPYPPYTYTNKHKRWYCMSNICQKKKMYINGECLLRDNWISFSSSSRRCVRVCDE